MDRTLEIPYLAFIKIPFSYLVTGWNGALNLGSQDYSFTTISFNTFHALHNYTSD